MISIIVRRISFVRRECLLYNLDIVIYFQLRNLAQHALPLVVTQEHFQGLRPRGALQEHFQGLRPRGALQEHFQGLRPRGALTMLQRQLSKMEIDFVLEP